MFGVESFDKAASARAMPLQTCSAHGSGNLGCCSIALQPADDAWLARFHAGDRDVMDAPLGGFLAAEEVGFPAAPQPESVLCEPATLSRRRLFEGRSLVGAGVSFIRGSEEFAARFATRSRKNARRDEPAAAVRARL